MAYVGGHTGSGFTPPRIIYISTDEGWLYLTVILDLYSRKVVSWSMSELVSGYGTSPDMRFSKATAQH